MIVKFIGTLGNADGAAKYVENERHVSDVIGSSLKSPIRQRGASPSEDALGRTGLSALDRLCAYVDQTSKTLADRRQITDAALQEMRDRAAVRPDIEDAWHHITIAYAIEDRDRVTDEVMAEDADGFVRALVRGENTRRHAAGRKSFVDADSILYIATTHRERDHIHVHLILCRVDEDGQVIANSGKTMNRAARRWCAATEQERGFRRTRDPDQEPGRAGGGDRGHVRREALPGRADQETVETIQTIADGSTSESDLAHRLSERGLELRACEGHHGWHLVDREGTVAQASDLGLIGRRRPDRIGAPPTPKQAARRDLWDAASEAEDWTAFEAGLTRRGLRADVDVESGQVTRIRRVDAAGGPVRARHWSPREMGFKKPPRKGDAAWWAKRKEQAEQRRREMGSHSAGHRQGQGKARTDGMGVITLPKKGQTWHDALVDLAATREVLAARIAARERAAFEARQQAEAVQAVSPEVPVPVVQPAASPVPTSAPASTPTPTATAWERERFQKDVEFVERSLTLLHRENDLTATRRQMTARGIALSFDQRTSSWYATRDGQIAAVPGLAGVPDDGRGSKIAPVQGPAVPDAKPKTDPPSVPAAAAIKKALPKPRLPDRDDRRRLPDWGP